MALRRWFKLRGFSLSAVRLWLMVLRRWFKFMGFPLSAVRLADSVQALVQIYGVPIIGGKTLANGVDALIQIYEVPIVVETLVREGDLQYMSFVTVKNDIFTHKSPIVIVIYVLRNVFLDSAKPIQII
jgi:hypothetical protein